MELELCLRIETQQLKSNMMKYSQLAVWALFAAPLCCLLASCYFGDMFILKSQSGTLEIKSFAHEFCPLFLQAVAWLGHKRLNICVCAYVLKKLVWLILKYSLSKQLK